MLKKLVRRLGFVIVCLATLVALFYAEEDWRGKHAWDTYRHQLEARGERLDLASLAPPTVPDDQNFAMTPLWKPLFALDRKYAGEYRDELRQRLDFRGEATSPTNLPSLGPWWRDQPGPVDLDAWREYLGTNDILGALQKRAPELDEIAVAVRRAYSRFPIQYQQGIMVHLPHLMFFRQLARWYTVRACAELAAGQTDQAAADVETVLRLANAFREEPIVISQLVRVVVLSLGLQPLWEGLWRHQWSAAQLARFQSLLATCDFASSCRSSYQCEELWFIDTVQQCAADPGALFELGVTGYSPHIRTYKFLARLLIPSGWFYQNLDHGCRAYQERLIPVADPVAGRFDPKRSAAMEAWIKGLRPGPYNFLLRVFFPALGQAASRFALAQTQADEAGLACALERYRLAHGQVPEKLGALVPEFAAKLPHDVVNGQPLHYQRTADGQFILYAVGWNEVDDGGTVVMNSQKKDANPNLALGDWVWKYPAPAVSTNP